MIVMWVYRVNQAGAEPPPLVQNMCVVLFCCTPLLFEAKGKDGNAHLRGFP